VKLLLLNKEEIKNKILLISKNLKKKKKKMIIQIHIIMEAKILKIFLIEINSLLS
jgi:hypothetical protein